MKPGVAPEPVWWRTPKAKRILLLCSTLCLLCCIAVLSWLLARPASSQKSELALNSPTTPSNPTPRFIDSTFNLDAVLKLPVIGNGSFKSSDTTPREVDKSGLRTDFLTGLPEHVALCNEILSGSIVKNDSLIPQTNGFVHTVLQAYAGHHHLLIRPDDVWLAIMTQFSFFVNANSEKLRSMFVKHQGQEEIRVRGGGTSVYSENYDVVVSMIAKKLREHLQKTAADAQIVDWILPNFTTTTQEDAIVASVLLMSSMKSYFTFTDEILCGIPTVTLSGDPEDWHTILDRVKKLRLYGEPCDQWADMLQVVLEEFVAARRGYPNPEFWSSIVHHAAAGGGCGGPTPVFTGWITAFMPFSERGDWYGNATAQDSTTPQTIIRGVKFPLLETDAVPAGYTTVDLKVDDNGAIFNTTLFGGHLGSRLVDGTTLAPQLLWSICMKKDLQQIQREQSAPQDGIPLYYQMLAEESQKAGLPRPLLTCSN